MDINHSYWCSHCDNYVNIEGTYVHVLYCPYCGSELIIKSNVNAKDTDKIYKINKQIKENSKKYEPYLPIMADRY
jgi:DNA-directed RNA polymerase subunit RPC12/RpoP